MRNLTIVPSRVRAVVAEVVVVRRFRETNTGSWFRLRDSGWDTDLQHCPRAIDIETGPAAAWDGASDAGPSREIHANRCGVGFFVVTKAHA
jgi:hypothetical protein